MDKWNIYRQKWEAERCQDEELSGPKAQEWDLKSKCNRIRECSVT